MLSVNYENDENENDEENENKFSLIIRKPQEGKTYICTTSIELDKSKDIHLVLTMNTLSAGMQFFGRLEDVIGSSSIIVFNSHSKSAGDCHHAKTTKDVIKLLRKYQDIKVIVCCAHYSRFKTSLNDIFEDVKDSTQLKGRNFKIHIDEAHKYIPEYRNNIREFNESNIIRKIIGYTATPDNIYLNDKHDKLFYEIYVCDVKKELGIIRSPCYYGVKDCNHRILENEVDLTHIINLNNYESKTFKKFYGLNSKFNFGNEMSFFEYLKIVLPTLPIKQVGFSYNFVPAYHRKITHIETAHIILDNYNYSNIIIINGDGIQLYRGVNNKLTLIKKDIDIIRINEQHRKYLLEPSNIIQTLIKRTPNFPTFITGFTCVGMSVTLINEQLGHFDNIIMMHTHCSKVDLYQLCRFLFNYSSWSNINKEKISSKKSLLTCSSINVYNTLIDYEKYIETLIENNSGTRVRIDDDNNVETCEMSSSQIRRAELNNIVPITHGWRVIEVDTNIETDVDSDNNFYNKSAADFYKNITGKVCELRSKPKRDNTYTNFWACSLTHKTKIYTIDEINNAKESNGYWDSYFQLGKNKLNYCTRFFIGYYNLQDSTRYNIYMKYAKINDTHMNIINKYCSNKKDDDNLNEEVPIINDETENVSDNSTINDDNISINSNKSNKTQYKRDDNYAITYLQHGWKLQATLKNINFVCIFNKTNNTFETIDTNNKIIFNSLNKAHTYHLSIIKQTYPDFKPCNAWSVFKRLHDNNTLSSIDNFDNHK